GRGRPVASCPARGTARIPPVGYVSDVRPTVSAPESSATRDQQLPRSVLIVDDDTMFRESLRASLEHEGFRVLEASTGDEALHVMADERVEVLVTDLSMPGLNGIELLRAMSKRSSATPL